MLEPSTNTAAAAPTSRNVAWFLTGAVVVGLLLRVPLLGRSLWFDEVCMSKQWIGTWEQLLAALYVDIHPPLFLCFMHCWNGVFGDGELSLRLPPLLAGLACIPLLYWTGHRLVGQTAALWAVVLLTLSPVHIWYSAEARLYTPMLACLLLCVGTFDRLLDPEQPRRRWLVVLHVANVAVMLALHYYLAVYIALLAALAPVVARGLGPRTWRMLAWHGVGLVLLVGFVFAKKALGEFQVAQDYLRAMTAGELYRFLFDWCLSGYTLAPLEGWPGDLAAAARTTIGAVFLPLGLWHLVRQRSRHRAGFLVPVCLLAIPVFLWVSAATGLGKTYQERSALTALPFVLLLVGSGLATLRRGLQRAAGVGVLLFCCVCLVALARFHETHWTVYKPNSDWRTAAYYLSQEIASGAAGRPVFTSTPNARPLSYYEPRIQDVKGLTQARDPASLGAAVRTYLGAALGDYAERCFRTLLARNQELLADAALRIYPCAGDPAKLESPGSLFGLPKRMRDDVCYLVRDEWHPHVSKDSSVEDLLRHPRVKVLEAKHLVGMSVYKVRILP
ncbi:MAG TPA: glycosyltransferase family 39 protein [Planctomycetota bacterium]|nr:glycosyltransferase family 39 protein [Planctomycetota bacterium]